MLIPQHISIWELLKQKKLLLTWQALFRLTDDESARRLDALIFKLLLAYVTNDEGTKNSIIGKLKTIGRNLEKKATIPQVYENREMLHRIQQDTFWDSVSIPQIEEIRLVLRGLMQYLKKEMQ